MQLSEIIKWSGGAVLLMMTIVQISPIKIDPWTPILRGIGKLFNSALMDEIKHTKQDVADMQRTLEAHIQVDNERTADGHRQRILRFNDELIRGVKHSEEHFIEVMLEIDKYEEYCRSHQEYKNSRAVLSIANIKRTYEDRMRLNDFLRGVEHDENVLQ